MATQLLEEITLRLPRELVQEIRSTAEDRHVEAGEVVLDWRRKAEARLHVNADPLEAQMSKLPDVVLRERATAWFPTDKQTRLDALLALNGEGKVSASESAELEQLIDEVAQHAAEAAAAKYILRQRAKEGRTG